MFLERLSVFDYSNNFYYKPNGEINTRSATDGIAMPNCTMYSFLRMHEDSEQTSRQNYWIRSCGGFGNAKTWYDSATLPKGSVPKVGAIAVWDGSYGHVNIVERVYDDGTVLMSESNYSANKNLRDWHFFNMRDNVEAIVGKSTLPGTGKLLGFIYPPVVDGRVARDEKKNQVEVIAYKVNVRKNPSISAEVFSKGLYCPQGIFDVKEWAEADGYTWAKLDNNQWIACGDWAKIYKAEVQDEKTIKELKAENERLKSEAIKLQSEIDARQNKLDKVKKIVA